MASRFFTPGRVNDLSNPSMLDVWSERVHGWFLEASNDLPSQTRFFNLLDRPLPPGRPVSIPWNAFPRKFALLLPQDLQKRWEASERIGPCDLFGRQAGFYVKADGELVQHAGLPFRDQDEYCEWRTIRHNGKIERVVFTCENPEYWEFLADQDRDLVLELYRKLVSPNVQCSDLFFQSDVFRQVRKNGQTVLENQRGRYNPLNRWNTVDGIVHLTHPANSLQAEIVLAAEATLLRQDRQGQLIVDDTQLICCAGYGSPNRSSDPTIGARVNGLVRTGLAVTIDDPVGLYISHIDLNAIETPGGAPEEWWHVKRPVYPPQDRPMVLRAEFAPPPGSGLQLEDVLVGGEPLRFGAQLAELITMVIYGRGEAESAPAGSLGCELKCCRIPNAPALLTHAGVGEDCPSAPAGLIPAVSAEDLAVQLTEAKPKTLAIGQMPRPNRRA